MKKMMIALGAIACAFGLQAATANWSIEGIQINGDWDQAVGDSAPKGWGVYFFDAKGTTSQAAMIALLAADSVDVDAWTTAMNNAGSIVTIDDNGMAGGSGVEMTADSNNLYAYVVIVDAATADKAQYAFVSDVFMTADTSPVPTSFSLGENGWINALNYDNAGQAGSNWYAVPEPTSGLLMLLGMAGLALRRRRA